MTFLKFNSEKDDIYSRVQQAGISATLIEDKNKYLEKIGIKVKQIEDTRWVLDTSDQEFDYIVRYYYSSGSAGSSIHELNYIVADNSLKAENARADTLYVSQKGLFGKMTDYFKSFFTRDMLKYTNISVKKAKGKVIDIGWKSDDLDFAVRLDSDNSLKEKIIKRYQTNKDIRKIDLFCLTRQTYHYGKIRTENLKPTSEDFEIMNIIASHIKSAWFGR